jgi:branched-chain amino acid transport system substrate-binding protein
MKCAIYSVIAGIAAAIAVAPALAQEPVKVGAIEALSGPVAKYGVPIRHGIELAVGEVNGKGGVLGGRKIEMIFEDSAGQKDQALNAMKKLLARDRVVAVFGPTLSNEMFAAGPAAVERQIPAIGTSTTADGITDIGEWIFRTAMPEADVIPVTVATVKKHFGIKRVALMYSNDDAFTKSGFDVMKSAVEKNGLEIATIETFSVKDTDFSAQLTKIKGLNVDAIGMSALAEAGAGAVLQARQLGIPPKVVIFGGNGFNSPKVAEIAGTAAEGLMVGTPWFIGKKDPLNQQFVAAYKQKFGDEPDQFAAQSYDSLFILAEAIERAGGTDHKALHAALLKTDHHGVLGPFRFTPHRDPASTEGVVVLAIKNGRFDTLE